MKSIQHIVAAAVAVAAASASAAEGASSPMQVQLGLTAVSGMSDLSDKVEAHNPQLSATTISPVGLSLGLYKRLGASWGLAVSIGPVVLARGDESFSIVPLGISARYDITQGDSISPYVRLGIEKAVVSGDIVHAGSAGGVLALGLDFGPADRNGWGLELAARATKVEVSGRTAAARQTVQPYKASLTGYWRF